MVDRGVDGPHEVAGVFLRDAVELLPVQVHLPLREGREPHLSLRVGQDELELHKGRDIVLADEIAQIVLILPPVGEEQLGVVCVQQERRRVVVHLLEGSGDAREMVFPPGVLV